MKNAPYPFGDTEVTMQFPANACVLVVDDDPDFLNLLTKQMSQIPGVSLDVARDHREAVQMLSENSYDLVVSDWAIESHTAPDVFIQADPLIEHSDQKVPVMFISGSDKVGNVQRLKGLKHFEPVSFLLKRCGPPLISLLAEHILARPWGPRELQPC
jgi:CheY-like chemotaxis protein